MKRELIISVCLAGIIFTGAAKADNSSDWGILLQNMANSVNANNTNNDELTQLKKQYSEWNTNLSTSENKVQNSFNTLVSTISPKSEAAKINNKLSSINSAANLSETDKSLQIAQILYDYSLNLLNNKNSVVKTLQNASTTKREEISGALKDLSSSTADYTSSFSNGSGLLKTITSNPKLGLSMASEYTELNKKMKAINTTLGALNNITTTLSGLLNN